MRKIVFFMSLLVAMFFLSSCTRHLADFTIISTRDVAVGQLGTNYVESESRVKARDTNSIILGTAMGMPDIGDAVDKAIEKCKDAVALTDVVIKTRSWHIFLYGQNSIIVEGTPVCPSKKIE